MSQMLNYALSDCTVVICFFLWLLDFKYIKFFNMFVALGVTLGSELKEAFLEEILVSK